MTFSFELALLILLCTALSLCCLSLAVRLYRVKKVFSCSVTSFVYAVICFFGLQLFWLYRADFQYFLFALPTLLISGALLSHQSRLATAQNLFFGVTIDQLKAVVQNVGERFNLSFSESSSSYWLAYEQQMVRFPQPTIVGTTSSGIFPTTWPDQLRQNVQKEITTQLAALPNLNYRYHSTLLLFLTAGLLFIPVLTNSLISLVVSFFFPGKQ